VKHIRRYHPDKVKKIMIVDLDAHQGNGHERDHLDDKDTFIIDFYNH
jgi:histone deacetylase 11